MNKSLWSGLAALSIVAISCIGTDPLEKPGPYDVYLSGEISVANPEVPGEPIAVAIYAPSEDGGASIAEGPFGFVLFMPGFGAAYGTYEKYTTHLASHGSIVVGMNFRTALGFDGRHDYLARQATWVLDHSLAAGGPLEGIVDPSRVATAGHSLGGKIAFYAAAIDARVGVVMAMDPSNSGGPPCSISEEWCNAYPVAPNNVTGDIGLLDGLDAASFIMRAEPALFNPDDRSNAEHFFWGLDGQGAHGVGSPALYFDMGPAGHASWVSLFAFDVARITKRTTAAWLAFHFNGEPLEDYFTGEVVQVDVIAGNIVSVETR